MTEKEQHSTTQHEETHSFHDPEQDEITLTDLLGFLIRRKVLILAITSVCTLVAIFYAQSIPLTYRATIGFLEPQEIYLSVLPPEIAKDLPGGRKIVRDEMGKIIQSKRRAFAMFLSKVMSLEFKKEVFKNGNFFKKFYGDTKVDTDQAVLQIHNSIILTKDKEDADLPNFKRPVYLAMEGLKPKVMSEFLTALAESAKENIIKDINDLTRLMINTKTNKISLEIDGLRLIVKEKRAKEALLFSEALVVAKNLGIKNNNFSKLSNSKFNFGITNQIVQDGKTDGEATRKTETNFDIRDNTLPNWFLYGEKALQQEILMRKFRKNGDVILGLAEKEVALKKYQAIDLSRLKVKVATISQPSIPPALPINSTKKKLIIAMGMTLGLFIGGLMAFIRNSLDQLRKRQISSTST